MNRSRIAVWLAVLALLSLGGYGFYSTFRYVEKEVPLPPRGEARYNPFYAVAESLRELGHEVESRAYLQWDDMAPGRHDVLLLASPLSSLTEAQIWQVQDWMYEGGRVLFAAPATQSEHESDLLDELGIEVNSGDYQCFKWRHLTDEQSAEVCSNLRLEYPHEDMIWSLAYQRRSDASALPLVELLDEREEDADDSADLARRQSGNKQADARAKAEKKSLGLFAVKASYGEGEWIALASLKPLTRKALEKPANAALAWQLLGPWLGEAKIHVVYAVEMPAAHVLLVRYGWPVLVPLLLALLGWLWMRSQSLGPLIPLPQGDRRALLEHIDAAGQFAFREQQIEPLYAECRRRFDHQLQKEHPTLAALDLHDQIQALAARWQLDPKAVAQALNPQDLGRADQFVLAIRTLNQMQGLS